MSGLVGFFFQSLWGDRSSSGRASDENVTKKKKSSEYRDSLSSCGVAVQKDKNVATDQSEKNGTATAISPIKQEENGEVPKKDLSMAQVWRQQNAQEMERFIFQRSQQDAFSLHSSSSFSEEEDSEEEEKEEDRDEEEESFLETQENAPQPDAHPQSPPQSEAELSPLLNTQPNSLPQIHDTPRTGHSPLCAKSVQDLSLSVKTFHLPLCRVDMIWGLRKTNRMRCQDSYLDSYPQPKNIPLAGQTYKHWEHDGPLAPFYKNVLSIEVTDLSTCSLKRRLRVFFYRKYAHKMALLLDQFHNPSTICGYPSDNNGGLLLSFQNVPHLCVLPYTPHSNKNKQPISLLDYAGYGELSKYCLCIGDKTNSFSYLSNQSFTTESGWFDDGGLQIRAFVKNSSSSNSNKNSEDEASLQQIVLDTNTVKQQEWSFDTASNIDNTSDEDSISVEAYEIACHYAQQRKQAQEKINNRKRKACELEDDDDAVTDVTERVNGQNRAKAPAAPAASLVSRTATAETTSAQNMLENNRSSVSPLPPSHAQPENRRTKRLRLSLTYHKLGDLQLLFDQIKLKKQRIQSGEIPFQTIKNEVNIYGTVLGFSPPTLTKRADWSMNITLIDESLPIKTALSMVIFQSNKDKLPKIRMAGDVLRAHRVVVQEYQGNIQLLGRRYCSFVVMRPRRLESASAEHHHQPSSSFSPDTWDVLSTASKSFSFSQQDGNRASSLWNWAQQRLMSHPTIDIYHPSKNTPMKFTISQMGAHDDNGDVQRQQQHYTTVNGDMTVFVTAKIPVPPNCRENSVLPRGFLRVWDGTGPPHSDPSPAALIAKDPPSEVLVAISNVLRGNTNVTHQNDDFDNSNAHQSSHEQTANNEAFEEIDIPPPKCLCGRVVNVAIWEGTHWDLVQDKDNFIDIGTPLRLRNVSDGRLSSGLRCLMVHPKSAMTPLPKRTFEVISLLKEHHNRIVRGDPYNPQSAVLPLHVGTDGDRSIHGSENEEASPPPQPASPQTADERLTSCSVDGVLTNLSECLSGPVPATFVSRFQVGRTYPPFDDKSAEGIKALCVQSEEVGVVQFQFALHLEDDGAELDAIVSNEVAETLFGVRAVDVCGGNSLRDCTSTTMMTKASEVVIRKLSKLLNSSCQGKIRSICVEGAKYFILDGLIVD